MTGNFGFVIMPSLSSILAMVVVTISNATSDAKVGIMMSGFDVFDCP